MLSPLKGALHDFLPYLWWLSIYNKWSIHFHIGDNGEADMKKKKKKQKHNDLKLPKYAW